MNLATQLQNEARLTTRQENLLNIAALCKTTRALGPGLRAAVWVQGCPLHCPGCVAPEWIAMKPARLVTAEALVGELLEDGGVTGLTISGGEPMLQAASLAALVRQARRERDLDVICFTGYQIENLRRNPPVPGVEEFLQEIDVLIDGPYIERLNDNLGMRGSKNQRVLHLSGRLRDYDFEHTQRKVEIRLSDGQAMMVGVPPLKLKEALNAAVDRANQMQWELLHYERV